MIINVWNKFNLIPARMSLVFFAGFNSISTFWTALRFWNLLTKSILATPLTTLNVELLRNQRNFKFLFSLKWKYGKCSIFDSNKTMMCNWGSICLLCIFIFRLSSVISVSFLSVHQTWRHASSIKVTKVIRVTAQRNEVRMQDSWIEFILLACTVSCGERGKIKREHWKLVEPLHACSNH